MAAKTVDLHQRCFFVLSGLSNTLGKSLAIEMCRRFKPGSVAVLIEASEENLQEVKKEIQYLENGVEVVGCCIGDWQTTNASMFGQLLESSLSSYAAANFELAFIMHNEGTGATHKLMEPQEENSWLAYVQENLYSTVALNQEFLKLQQFEGLEKLVVNISSSLQLQPFVYNSVMGSCQVAREMYFRAMADTEGRNCVSVLTYAPGIMTTHMPCVDLNNNTIDLDDLNVDEKLLKMPRVSAEESTLKLINILQNMSFCSGHDVDYYDTFHL